MSEVGHQQGGRLAIGLGQLQHALPINRVLMELVHKKHVPDFMAAAQKVEDCGDVPDIVGLAEQILDIAHDAKQFGRLKNDPLTDQGIAFMMLYSAEGTNPAFYQVLNNRCYDPDRNKIMPFGECIVGTVKHMRYIEPYPNGVVLRGVKADLVSEYPEGREVVWHGFCSTTKSIAVLSNPMFCGDSGKRTIFQITLTQGQAREITRYSLIAAEDEVLLPPGCRFKVDSVLPQGDLTIIQMTELRSKAWIMDLSTPHEPQPEAQSLVQQPTTTIQHGAVQQPTTTLQPKSKDNNAKVRQKPNVTATALNLLALTCVQHVVRVVCYGCDWTAGGKSGAFSSVGLAVKSLACLRGHIPCRLSARFADGDVSAAACRACGMRWL